MSEAAHFASDGLDAEVDEIDRRILSLLREDARRSYGSIGRQVYLSASAVKRRVDDLQRSRALRGFTADLGSVEQPQDGVEALVFLSLRPCVERAGLVSALARRPEVTRAWMISGESDAVVQVRAATSVDLDRCIQGLKQEGLVWRVRSEPVLGSEQRPSVAAS